MRTFVLTFLCLVIGMGNILSQDLQQLKEKQVDYVDANINLPYSAEIIHHIYHFEEEHGRSISKGETKKLLTAYYKQEFVKLHRESFRKAGYQFELKEDGKWCNYKKGDPLSCLNGGFEDSFDHYLGRWADDYFSGGDDCNPDLTYTDFDSPDSYPVSHFAIVDESAMDPIVPILNRVEFDKYAGRVNSHLKSPGETNFNREVDQLAKKFYVTEETSNFTMHYAVVMQNPTGHVDQQPFFNVEILAGENYSDVIFDFCFDAENDNELVTYSGQNKFKNWSCLEVDLKEHIGCPVLLQVTSADCAQTAHFGYSYIDGICKPCGKDQELVAIKEVGPCEDNSVKISGAFDVPDGYDLEIIQLNGPNLEVTTNDFDIDYVNNSFCVTLSEQDYIDAGITGCVDLVVTALFGNGSDLITSVSNSVEICLTDLQCDGCLTVEITNVECINNGTTDPSDDQWTFDIEVSSTADPSCGYWSSTGDYEGSGSLDNVKVVYMGQISDYGSTVEFYVYDGCDKECGQMVTIDVPKDCSAPCDLEAEVTNVGECKDDGTYSVQLDVTGSNGECWMAVMKKENGDEVLIGNYSGDGSFDLGPFDANDGNFVLWVKLCDYFDCVLDLYVFAPECCLQVDITNVMCLNNGTADPSDDQWTFDIEVSSNSSESCGYWKTFGDVDEAGSLDQVKTIWMGQISDYGSTINFTVIDGCDESCFMDIEIDVPEPCSPDCDLTLKEYKIGECDEKGDYYITVSVVGTNGECWMAKIKKEDGTEEVIGTYYGDGEYQLGPFNVDDGNFTLWIKMCEQFDCLLDVYIFAPDCEVNGKLQARNAAATDITIYPNPTSGEINIEVQEDRTIKSVTLVDISGQIHFKTDNVEANQIVVSKTDMPTGIYIMTVILDNDELLHSKILKIE